MVVSVNIYDILKKLVSTLRVPEFMFSLMISHR